MTSKATTPAAAATALLAALSLSGCALLSPVQTDQPYQPSDGVNLSLGPDLDVRGLVVVGGDKKDGPGRVVGQLLNTSADAVSVTFSAGADGKVTATVKGHESLNLANENLTLTTMPVVAGDLVPLKISAQSTGDNLVQVPVVRAEGYYEDLKPSS